VVFHPRQEGLEYGLEHAVIGGEDLFLVLHNHTGADFELGRAPFAPTTPEAWQPLVPYDERVRLEDVAAYAGHLVVHQRSGGLTQLRILELGDDGPGDDYLVDFPQEVYTVGGSGGAQFDQPIVRVSYTSLTVPSSVYDYDVRTRDLTLRKQQPVRGHDPSAYEEHRLWAVADDGERVPISLVHRVGARGADGDRPIPFLLYGYGAYELSIDPGFSVAWLSLLDRGAGVAIAHVRGGGEMGRRWYDDGKLLHKRHTFSDFAACARHLVQTGWSTHDRIVGEGGSAGGLLIGVAANEQADLFGGLVAEVPFVDALTSMLDSSLPLTVAEYEEWGNPNEDEAFRTMLAYSPYDNLKAGPYPAMLVKTSLNDSQVMYWEPAKYVAKLRTLKTNPELPLLLHINMDAGHGGASGRYDYLKEIAFDYAFILTQLGAPYPKKTDSG
jgi:oligopeptidase B